MALPTLEKTWQHDVNQVAGNTGGTPEDDHSDFYYKVKASFIGFASGQWTVTSSSGKNGGGALVVGLADYWLSRADIVFATGSHAWIVMTNSATGAQVCFDCILAAGEDTKVYFAPKGGYATTALVDTARPTAPVDEIYMGSLAGMASGNWNGKLHISMSTDGECTRLVLCRGGFATGFWFFDSVKSPVIGWTYPQIALVLGAESTYDLPSYASLNDAAKVKSYITAEFLMFMTCEGYGIYTLGKRQTVADSQTGGWPMLPMGLYSITTGHIGRKGALYDMWWGSITRITGDNYPNDASYQFAQFGDIILPWDGTLPQVT